MASRMVHYVIAKQLLKQLDIKDSNAFLIGAIIPDSYCVDCNKVKSRSHFLSNYEIGRTYDYLTFYQKYLVNDQSSFALGYFLHLLMDCINLKDIIANTVYTYPKSMRKEAIALLYEDMHVHNYLLKKRFDLHYDLKPLDTWEVAEVDINDQIAFLKLFEADFNDEHVQPFHMLTSELLESYMNKCINLASDILNKVMNHQSFINIKAETPLLLSGGMNDVS